MDTDTTDNQVKDPAADEQPPVESPAASSEVESAATQTETPSPQPQTSDDTPQEPPSSGEQPPPSNGQGATVRIVAIKFRDAGKLYDFDARNFELENGVAVVVETDRGRALGEVVLAPRETPRSQAPDGLKGVLRIASDKDLESAQRHAAREHDALRYCRKRAAERKMEMKLVRAEYLFDGSKIIFYFTADGRIDFRELVKDLAHHFHTRIEMRQIGVRDEAKLTGGIGVCGRELCCCSFLREFEPVSVKMAKEQGLALNPSKISGQCGRLLCCLGYEYETYCGLKKGLPKCGRKVKLGDEIVEVTQIDLLRQQVTIRHQDDQTDVIAADEIRGAKVEQPGQGGNKPDPEKSDKGDKADRRERGDKRREEQRSRPSHQGKRQEKKPEPDEQATTEPNEKHAERPQDQPQPPEGERKRRRRPRRRRKKKPGGPDQGQGPSTPDKTS